MLSIGSAVCKTESATAANALADSAALDLPLPVPPDSLTVGEEKIAYILNHFWDTLDFKNDQRVHDPAFLEQNFSNFIAILSYAGNDARREAVKKAVKLAGADLSALTEFAEVAELYLYALESPYVSEELYEVFLEAFTEIEVFDEVHAERYAWQLRGLRKNRPGMTAADFGYVTPDGQRSTLHSTPATGEILLIFYDPDCGNCHKIIGSLREDSRVTEGIRKGELTVMAIYSGDNFEQWKSTVGDMPADWIVGYENGRIEEEELYDFQAMPTVFLLDKDKKILRRNIKH